MMLEAFYPDMMVDRVQDIDLNILKKKSIKGLILDIDNTLVPEHVEEADQNAVDWIEGLKKDGFKVCIVSNATKKRVVRFNEKLQLFAIHRAKKPVSFAFRKAARLMDIDAGQIAMIGDQIFTDVFGSKRVGMFSILVKPIHLKEAFFVKLKRLPEKYVLKKYMKKRDGNNGYS
jgi:HAD superfamily phosphatase (TIGR01668 family)